MKYCREGDLWPLKAKPDLVHAPGLSRRRLYKVMVRPVISGAFWGRLCELRTPTRPVALLGSIRIVYVAAPATRKGDRWSCTAPHDVELECEVFSRGKLAD